jgi:hypothetical protein
LLQKVAADQGLVPEFEVLCSFEAFLFLNQLILMLIAFEDYT